MNSELKPCPFCGGEAELNESTSGFPFFSIWCKNENCIAGAVQVKDFDKERLVNAWNTRHDRTCHMTLKKSGPLYDVYYFDCCEKEWAEPRCYNGVVEYPGIVCPWCGAEVVGVDA